MNDLLTDILERDPIPQFGQEFVQRRTEAAEHEITLLSTQKHVRAPTPPETIISSHSRAYTYQGLWYSEDGTRRKRFRSRGLDARGYEVIREVPLRIGDNWHLVFALNPSNGAPETRHHITVFQHMYDKVRPHARGGVVIKEPTNAIGR